MKPKFQNFDYCGKKCAALAIPGRSDNAGFATSEPQATGGSNTKDSSANNQQQATQTFDTTQLAGELAYIVRNHV